MKPLSDWMEILVLAVAIMLSACGGGGGSNQNGAASTSKEITSFSFTNPPVVGVIDESAKTVSASVPEGTDRSALVATFETTGASVKVGSGVQESGHTTNDFTHPVEYVVTASDGSTATYTVTVSIVDIAPGPVTLTGATAKTTSIDVAWTNPTAPDLDHVEIIWSLNGMAVNTASVDAGMSSFSITGLVASSEYAVTLNAVDAAGNKSATPTAFSVFTTSSGEKTYSAIYTVDAMNAVHGNLSANYILMADLDLNVAPFNTGSGWTPIGDSTTPYSGIFNGNHHTIANLMIDAGSGNPFVGLFGGISGAFIYNLGLASINISGGNGGLVGHAANSRITNCSVVGGSILGTNDVGGLIGYADASTVTGCSSTATVVGTAATGGLVGSANGSTLNNCTVSAVVTGVTHTGGIGGNIVGTNLTNCSAAGSVAGGGANTGGLAGYTGMSTVTACRATAAVTGSGDNNGGLVGYNDQTEISESFATGAVAGSANYVGGLVGYNSYGAVTNCYARGAVSGGTYVGGFAGLHKCQSASCLMLKNYSTGAVSYSGLHNDNGGFVGYDWYGNDISRSYFDLNTSGQSLAGKGIPETTVHMKTQALFANDEWDFTNFWSIDTAGVINNGYPYLKNNSP